MTTHVTNALPEAGVGDTVHFAPNAARDRYGYNGGMVGKGTVLGCTYSGHQQGDKWYQVRVIDGMAVKTLHVDHEDCTKLRSGDVTYIYKPTAMVDWSMVLP
jgi:hypothetical protein|tara:strand:+ start:390 stop:695 length:306 start_codon:yes stop_codon:yes gene_type:complete